MGLFDVAATAGEVGFLYQSAKSLIGKVGLGLVPSYKEEITVEVVGDDHSTKNSLWQLALSIAFGRVAPFTGQLQQPKTLGCEYDVFGKRVLCYIAYEYSSLLTIPNGSRGSFGIQSKKGGGKTKNPQYADQFLRYLLTNSLSGIDRLVIGPGIDENVIGGNWPAWLRSYSGLNLPENLQRVGSGDPAETPAPTFDTGSRGDWLGVQIAAELTAYAQKLQQQPFNYDYLKSNNPQGFSPAAEQPLVNYPAIDPYSLNAVVALPASDDPYQVNNSDPLGN